VQGKEFVVGVHNVETGKSLSTAKLDCCNELRRLLTGFEQIIQEVVYDILQVSFTYRIIVLLLYVSFYMILK